MPRDRWRFFDTEKVYFLTCSVVGWLPVFTRPKCVEIVLDSWRYLQANRDMILFGYVILENHLHWAARLEDPSEDCGDFKSFTARSMIDWLRERGEAGILRQFEAHKDAHKTDRKYQLWQEGNHPEIIPNEDRLRQKLEYMHNNPLKRGYVDDPIHWRYSSARNYAGRPGLIEVRTRW